MPSSGGSDLTARVTTWLEKTGFPLEVRTARALAQNLGKGWEAYPNYHYHDVESGSLRESDVEVDWMYRDPATGFSLWYVLTIECKSTSKPWIVLRGEG